MVNLPNAWAGASAEKNRTSSLNNGPDIMLVFWPCAPPVWSRRVLTDAYSCTRIWHLIGRPFDPGQHP